MDRQLCGGDCLPPRFISISGRVARTDRCGPHMDGVDIVVPDSIIVVRNGVQNISVLSKLIHLPAFISATMAGLTAAMGESISPVCSTAKKRRSPSVGSYENGHPSLLLPLPSDKLKDRGPSQI